MSPPGLAILVVCRANRYRSPLAEHFLQSALADRDVTLKVRSAGTSAQAGAAMDPEVQKLLTDHRVSVSDRWRSQLVSPQLIRTYDLILTSDAARRADVVKSEPRALHSTFTLRQFARLLAALSTSHLVVAPNPSALLDALQQIRGQLQPMPGATGDIDDPAGHSRRALRKCAGQIETIATSVAQSFETVLSR